MKKRLKKYSNRKKKKTKIFSRELPGRFMAKTL